MSRAHSRAFFFLSLIFVFLSGCGGFKGVLAPTLSSITPSTVNAGGDAFTLTATGTNYTSGTTILWNGIALPTTVTSATQLTASVSAAQIASAGTVNVGVMRADSTSSGTLALTITGSSAGGAPVLTAISPTSVTAGSADFTITATGTGFVSGADITLNGTAIPATFDSATQLHATVPAASVAAAGTINVGVTNPDKTTSNSLTFTINAAAAPLALTAISPSAVAAGSADFTMSAFGTGFISGAAITLNGTPITTTFDSATQLHATITAASVAVAGTITVGVTNPDKTTSNTITFTIIAGAPSLTLTGISPAAVSAGSAAFTMTATGTGFVSGAAITLNGTAITTTFDSATQLHATVPAASVAAAGTITVGVTNPDKSTSNSLSLTIFAGAPSLTLTGISPAAASAGSAAFTMTATGTGFVSGATITLNGAAIATTFDSATQLHATIPAANVATVGTITVGVTNPDNSTSNTLVFTILAGGVGPAPTLTSISPNTSPTGITSPLTLTATGTNFVTGSTVMWSGVAMTTTFVSSTQLTATIPPTQFETATTAQIYVLNPDSTVSNELAFTITTSPATTPTLSAIFNPSLTQSSKVGDPAFTLTLCGSSFAGGAVAYFGNTALTTSAPAAAGTDCVTQSSVNNLPTQQVTAQVPAALLTASSEMPVTIKNTQSSASNSLPYYVGISVYLDQAADVVWDSANNLLYVSKPKTAQHNPDTVMAFRTKAGLNDAAAIWTYSLAAGSNPNRLALSSDGKYLYVGLDGAASVQQLVITGATTPPTAGTTIPLGTVKLGTYYALDLAVSPTADATIAVARGITPTVNELALGGVAIYDGAIQRPNVVGPSSVPNGNGLLDTLQWSANGYQIYAANNETVQGDLYILDVAANGIGLTAGGDHPAVFTIPNLFIHLDPTTGILYGDDGLAVDPRGPVAVGNANTNGIMTPDPATGHAYFISHPAQDTNPNEYLAVEFDLTTLAPGIPLDLYQVDGIPQHLVRWNNSTDGTSGLAFTTKKFNCSYTPCNAGDSRLYVIDLPL